jgi:hypothetical protein
MLALTPAKPALAADFDGFAAVALQPLSALPPHQVPALELRASRRGAARLPARQQTLTRASVLRFGARPPLCAAGCHARA